jgi:hypothetical protein
MALVSCYGITCSIVSVLSCIPFSKFWVPDTPGSCIGIGLAAFPIAAAVLCMVFDAVIFSLPIPVLWGLKRKSRNLDNVQVIIFDSPQKRANRLGGYIWSWDNVSV